MYHQIARTTAAAVAALTLLAAGCGDDDDGAAGDAAPVDSTTAAPDAPDAGGTDAALADVLAVATAEADLTTFLTALEAAGIMDGLHGDGPFTVFIPTDAAFTDDLAESGMTQEDLLASGEMLRSILDNHIVDGLDDAELVMSMAGQSFTSLAGNPLDITVAGDTVMVGGATVERYVLQASNGVIHVVDSVIIRPAARRTVRPRGGTGGSIR